MKVFLTSACAAILIAVVANVVLTQGVQESAKTAFSSSTARP